MKPHNNKYKTPNYMSNRHITSNYYRLRWAYANTYKHGIDVVNTHFKSAFDIIKPHIKPNTSKEQVNLMFAVAWRMQTDATYRKWADFCIALVKYKWLYLFRTKGRVTDQHYIDMITSFPIEFDFLLGIDRNDARKGRKAMPSIKHLNATYPRQVVRIRTRGEARMPTQIQTRASTPTRGIAFLETKQAQVLDALTRQPQYLVAQQFGVAAATLNKYIALLEQETQSPTKQE